MPILKNKLLFIHIPKTGGTFIKSSFNLNKSDPYLYNDTNFVFFNNIEFALQHLNYTAIVEKNLIEKNKLNSMYTFTFIRNPYTRVLSEYFYSNRNVEVFNGDIFHEFVVNSFITPRRDHHLPQSFYFDIKYDFVGKFENLIVDLKQLCKNVNISINLTTEKINASRFDKNELVDKIKPETIDVINEVFSDDFDLGDYNKL